MGDSNCSYSNSEPLIVVACADPTNERRFLVARHILCISPVLKGYIEKPDTPTTGLKRNGDGTLSLNNEGDVVEVMLRCLRQAHGDNKFSIRPSDGGVVFLVKLYKLALSLGLTDLWTVILQTLRFQTGEIDDFVKVALEASRWKLIEQTEFRHWFTTYVNRREDELLKTLDGDIDSARLCRIFVSALAKNVDEGRDSSPSSKLPPTPPSSSSRKRKEDLGPNPLERVPSQTPLKSKETLGSNAKKRKLRAHVEEASESD